MANNIRIKTIEKLEELLTEDIAWRKKEMLSLKILVENDSVNESILIRSGIALLSAHFEGFVKKASNYYVGYVSEQKRSYNDLKANFAALKMEKEFMNCAKSEKLSVHKKLLEKYDKINDTTFCDKLDMDNLYISTHSNPSSKELQEILISIGIESDVFQCKSNYIDASLLANRHSVVHGDRSNLDKDDFFTTFDIIIELIDNYRELIIESAEQKKYLKEQKDVT